MVLNVLIVLKGATVPQILALNLHVILEVNQLQIKGNVPSVPLGGGVRVDLNVFNVKLATIQSPVELNVLDVHFMGYT
jgi:hypothetical protein